jgi:DNA polymerase I-like protein with 3'-5' exonuclease and polymerase domains/uracil-DNA glycosylase
VLAEAPGIVESQEGRPLCGPSGVELSRSLAPLGVTRSAVSLGNVLACMPPDANLGAVMQKSQRVQAKARRDGLLPGVSGWPKSPVECCAPRLKRDIEAAATTHYVPLGKYATAALVPGFDTGILAVRGTLLPQGSVKIAPTVHPAFVLRQQRWRHVFLRDLRRAWDWFAGRLEWQEPASTYVPTVDQLRAFLYGGSRFYCSDVEVAKNRWALEPMLAGMLCIGFADADGAIAMCVPFVSIDGLTRFYAPDAEAEMRQLIAGWLADPTIRKVGHNFGQYDRMVCERAFGVTPAAVLDTLLVDKVVAPEMPHNLGFVGSFYTNVHAWKADHKLLSGRGKRNALDLRTDRDEWKYNLIDCVVNARVARPLCEIALTRRQAVASIGTTDAEKLANCDRSPLDRDHAMQVVAVGLHKVGQLVDQDRRAVWDTRLRGEIATWANKCRSLLVAAGVAFAATQAEIAAWGVPLVDDPSQAGTDPVDDDEAAELVTPEEAREYGIEGFNPGSPMQVGAVLFGQWHLPPPIDVQEKDLYTLAGDMRTSAPVLQAYMVDKRVLPEQRRFIHAVRMFRAFKKVHSTYVARTLPLYGATGINERSALLTDGRIHASWGTIPIGRFFSGQPLNMQNWPYKYDNRNMKELLIPAPGNVYVGADMDQLHLRIIANYWRIPSLLECFARGWDPHGVFAETILGDTYRKSPGYNGFGKKPDKGSRANQVRDVAKRDRFAGAYGAQPETQFRVLRADEDQHGRLSNPKLTLPRVYAMYETWMAAEPEWKAAWSRHLEEFKVHGYLESPLLKRRFDFLDQVPTDMTNFPILSCEGDIMGGVTCRLYAALLAIGIGPGGAANSGIVNQCHDSITVECPAPMAERVRGLLMEHMNFSLPGWPVPFTAEAGIGDRYSEV